MKFFMLKKFPSIKKYFTRKWKLVYFILFLFFIFNSGLFFLIHGLKINLNTRMNRMLNHYGILVDISPVRTSFIPYPHLRIKRLHLNIDHETHLTFHDIKIDIDLWKLMVNRELIVKKIYILDTMIKVKGHIDPEIIKNSKDLIKKGFYIPPEKVEHILKRVRYYIRMIPNQFNYSESLFASKVDIVIEDIDTEKPFIVANQVDLKNINRDLLTIHIDGRMQNWFFTSLDLEIWKDKENELNWIKRIIVFHSGKFDLDFFNSGINRLENQYSGDIDYYHAFTLKFPLKKIDHYGSFYFNNIHIKDSRTKSLFRIHSSNPLRIHFAGFADQDKTILPYLVFYYRDKVITGNMEWIYKKFSLDFNFEKGNIPYLYLMEIAPDTKPGFVTILKNSKVFFQYLRLNPWKESLIGGFYIDLKLGHKDFEKPITAAGSFSIFNHNLFSKKIEITGYNTNLIISDFQYLNFQRILFNATGKVSSLWGFKKSRGFFNIQLQADCYHTSYQVMCQKNPYYISGNKIFIPSGTASRFFRLMSVDFFKYWKSFKSRSEIEINKIQLNGYLMDDTAYVKNSILDSDIGYFRLNGYYNLFKKDSMITLRFFPLNMDKFVQRIPIIGAPFEKAIAFTSEIIIYLELKNEGWKVKRFFIGKGVEKLNKK